MRRCRIFRNVPSNRNPYGQPDPLRSRPSTQDIAALTSAPENTFSAAATQSHTRKLGDRASSDLSKNTGRGIREEYSQWFDEKWDKYINSRIFGFLIRCVAFGAVVYSISSVLYRAFVRSQEQLPIAQRYNAVLPWTRITLIEKNENKKTGMTTFRFALPNTYDYTGHKPVMSVRLFAPDPNNVKRFFTPTNDPNERGIIEFAIRTAGVGVMKSSLKMMNIGDHAYMGRWMKEFEYEPNKWPEVAIVDSKSGVSVALQLLNYSAALRTKDTTKFKVIHCCNKPTDITMKEQLEALVKKMDGRLQVTYNVQGVPKKSSITTNPDEQVAAESYSGLVGNLTADVLDRYGVKPYSQVRDADGNLVMKSNHVLVCGSPHLMAVVCGSSQPIHHFTYLRAPLSGFLRELGFKGSQVTPFGTTWCMMYQTSKLGGSFF